MTETQSTTLGFVGLGHMGGNMTARLLAAGYPVFGESRHREGAQQLVDEGLSWCDTPRAVAEAAEIVLTSIPDDNICGTWRGEPTASLPPSGPARSGST
jgi:3-hydroxyisobutyrate dehydrogenase-like beta-hydroxyacid dehydrogenase